jgi:hypothetical protein
LKTKKLVNLQSGFRQISSSTRGGTDFSRQKSKFKKNKQLVWAGNTKGGSIPVQSTSCLTSLD